MKIGINESSCSIDVFSRDLLVYESSWRLAESCVLRLVSSKESLLASAVLQLESRSTVYNLKRRMFRKEESLRKSLTKRQRTSLIWRLYKHGAFIRKTFIKRPPSE